MQKTIQIKVTSPVDCTEEQFKEWVEYNTGYIGGIDFDNPLCDEPLIIDSLEIIN